MVKKEKTLEDLTPEELLDRFQSKAGSHAMATIGQACESEGVYQVELDTIRQEILKRLGASKS